MAVPVSDARVVEPARRRRLRPAALEAAALLAVTVVGLGMLLDAAWTPLAGAHRNPAFRRNWPAWVAAAEPRRSGETLIVLLGNSQGYGREVSEDDIYAARLGPLVSARSGRPTRVVNWAVPGGNALDYVLTAAAAHRLEPDVVLLMTSPGSLGRWLWRHADGVEASGSDLAALIGDPAVRDHLPARFVERFVHANERVDAWLAGIVPLWRYRDLPRSWLVAAVPALATFEKDSGQERWFFGEAGERRIEPWEQNPTSAALRDITLDALAGVGARRLVVRMPVHSTLQGHNPAWLPNVARAAVSRGVEAIDLRAVLPDDVFHTATHLDAAGHERLANVLAELLAP